MIWQSILQNDVGAAAPLRQRIDALFAQQRDSWPALREGETALGQMQQKTLMRDGQSVVVQLNPARRRSTQAQTDAKSVAARACFLCPENMPAEERGVAFEDLVVMPNPYPILPLHSTIADREHRPQRLAGRFDTFLRLAAALGPDMAALYNGPRCGASAPDHFHFQAAQVAGIPIVAQLPTAADGSSVAGHSSFGRRMVIFRGADAADVAAGIQGAIEALWHGDAENDEPMFNLLGRFEAGRYMVVLFPRAAHRPACYFASGDAQLLISPAILEMCGILVTTEPEHFARIDAAAAYSVYKEISIDSGKFDRLIAKLT